MNDISSAIMIGRFVSAPELKYTPKNVPVCTFRIAVNESYKTSTGEKKDNASFFSCVAYHGAAKILSEYGRKGHRICVHGRLKQRSWNDKDGKPHSIIELIIENFQFLQPKDSFSSSASSSGNSSNDIPLPEEEGIGGFNEYGEL